MNNQELNNSKEQNRINAGMFVKYFTCPHWLWFDRFGDPAKRTEPSLYHEFLLEKKLLHEEEILSKLNYISVSEGSEIERQNKTKELMAAGVERIYHGLLISDDLIGEPDLLEKRDTGSSIFGPYHYEPVEIKNSNKLTDAMRLQLTFYGDLLSRTQGFKPKLGHVMNSSGQRVSSVLADMEDLYQRVLGELRILLAGKQPEPRLSSGCRISPWFSECIDLAESVHDVALLYNIKSRILEKLRAQGIKTVEDAVEMNPEIIHSRDPEIKLALLRRAKIQAEALIENQHFFREAVVFPDAKTEIFFDIESDPLRSADYLFGLLVRDDMGERYEYHLAESPEEEEKMWRSFLRWLEGLSDDYTVYHFGTFEYVCLTMLENKYGGSVGLNKFFGRMIDLNEEVKEKVVLPLYFYGIKDIGRYIGFERKSLISSGGDSVAVYEQWLQTKDKKIIENIIEYNRDDVEAARELKDWLQEESKKIFD